MISEIRDGRKASNKFEVSRCVRLVSFFGKCSKEKIRQTICEFYAFVVYTNPGKHGKILYIECILLITVIM